MQCDSLIIVNKLWLDIQMIAIAHNYLCYRQINFEKIFAASLGLEKFTTCNSFAVVHIINIPSPPKIKFSPFE